MSNCAKHPDVTASAFCRTCGKPVCSSCARDVRGVIYCEECLVSHVGDTMPPRPGYVAPPPGATQGPPSGEGHPGLAAILGFIPGVGAMYNGQFVKGFIHVLIFITFIWLGNNVSEVFGALVAAWIFYMVFDAYQTAKAMKYGLPLPDPFGINNLAGGITNEASYARRMHEAGERIGEGFSTAASAFNRVGTNPPGDPQSQNYSGAPPQQPYSGVVPQEQYVAPTPPEPPPVREVAPTGAVILIVLGVLFLLGNVVHLHLDRWWPLLLIAVGVWLFIRRQQQKVE